MDLHLTRRLPLFVGMLLISIAFAAAPATAASTAGGASVAQQVDEEGPDEDVVVEEEPVDGDMAADEELFDDEEPIDAEATAEPADELAPIDQATAELGRAKRAGADKVTRLGRDAAATLRPCLRGGRGWKRMRAVRHAPQRALYVAAARKLLADMRVLLEAQRSRIEVYGPAFERYVTQLEAVDVSSPLLTQAIAAQGRRLAAYRDVRSVTASCAVFNRLATRVREFPTRSAAEIVRADYRATPVARKIQRHISSQLAAIDRRHGITHRDARTLEEAAEQMVAAGGSPGAALGFQYALSLR